MNVAAQISSLFTFDALLRSFEAKLLLVIKRASAGCSLCRSRLIQSRGQSESRSTSKFVMM